MYIILHTVLIKIDYILRLLNGDTSRSKDWTLKLLLSYFARYN